MYPDSILGGLSVRPCPTLQGIPSLTAADSVHRNGDGHGTCPVGDGGTGTRQAERGWHRAAAGAGPWAGF